jgi:plasmid stabilization system protein ParE
MHVIPTWGCASALDAYLIFYDVTDRVEIVRILHGARHWQTQLRSD